MRLPLSMSGTPGVLWGASLSPHRHNHHHLHNHHHHVSIHAKCACHYQCLEPQGSCATVSGKPLSSQTQSPPNYTIITIMCQHMLNASAIINVWNPRGPVLLWVASLSPHKHNHHHHVLIDTDSASVQFCLAKGFDCQSYLVVTSCFSFFK